MNDMIFFGEKGLTSTSANHLANMAKEYVRKEEIEITNISFINEDVTLVGGSTTHNLKVGVSSLEDIPAKLNKIALANSLIAWLREAIKAKQKMQEGIRTLSLEQFCVIHNIEYPSAPTPEDSITEEEYYRNLPIATRNRYFQLEAMCATLGKYIHPSGSLAEQREVLIKALSNPTKVSGNGRDTLIYKYTQSVSTESINNLFYALQEAHREAQKALNSIKFEAEKAVLESQTQCNAKYKEAISEYTTRMEEIRAKYRKYITEKTKEISNLKIVIPDSLSGIYETINNLGK